ncbi:MAG: hypothetical protein BWK75_01865 [Candidatus Altiarchaeales archaeon A3]|nr:MAG: hypothetical protein BWK75_01865 [Candidatus Altiarchaeales archaeon A3]
MEQDTKNAISFLLNFFLPGIGTIIHGEIKRGLIQIVSLIAGVLLIGIVRFDHVMITVIASIIAPLV